MLRTLSVVLLALALLACSSEQPAALQTLDAARLGALKGFAFRPGFEYLQLDVGGRRTYLALGARRLSGLDVDEYWYSGASEELHLKNGRVVQALGMTREVRSSSAAPDWGSITSRVQVWVRERDAMPSYQVGLKQFVISQQVEPTPEERALAPEAVRWVQEEVKSPSPSTGEWVYDEVFALDPSGRVVYSSQCVAPDLCMRLRPLGEVARR